MLYFFYFAFLLIKNSIRVFETGSVGLAETQLFFFYALSLKTCCGYLLEMPW